MTSTVSDDTQQLLDRIAETTPEWRAWLTLIGETLHAASDPAWASATPEPRADRTPNAPLLDGIVLTLDARMARNWVTHLLATAAGTGSPQLAPLGAVASDDHLDARALLEAAIAQDEERLGQLARDAGIEPAVLSPVAQLAAMPLLQACGRHLEDHAPAVWPHGYCPKCGAWPTMADVRGLERNRRLLCGRCGGDWGIALLRCPYCRTNDHQRLGSLVPEENGELRKVDTCDECRGYIKTVTTLHKWPALRVALEDLASVDLDVVALDRGYIRPSPPGYPLKIRVELTAPRRRFLGWRS
ncbi:MAG: formate dehydrogenase accessory protein FdhE [Chloroflexota bacterium]|nr:formate dehydrogenase accessory protein FdhE [Chloroflexota bacterium]